MTGVCQIARSATVLKNLPKYRAVSLCSVVLLVSFCAGFAEAATKGRSASSASFRDVDAIMNEAVASGEIPGAVLLVGQGQKIVFRKAFGYRSLEPTHEPMTVDTIFDLASLTKCIATTSDVMVLLQQGRLRLNDPVARYLPEFAQNGKQDITLRELLTHYSGLRPDLDLSAPWQGRDIAFDMAMREKPRYPPGSRFLYSDINFEVLGFVVEKVSGEALNSFTSEHVFGPLGMHETRFLPPETWRARVAPTEYDESGKMLRGIVHDPTARRMGGVAGHAGLFSTADDLFTFAQELLAPRQVLTREAVDKMSTPQQPSNAASQRGLGWDIDSPFASPRGEFLPVGSFGHTGFTGTSLWVDPSTKTSIILLTNAVHPHVGKSVVSLRSRVASAVTSALQLSTPASEKLRLARITGYNESQMASRRIDVRDGDTRLGIDVLEAHGFRELSPDTVHPKRVGLVTNITGVDSAGRQTKDVLALVPGIKLTAIFSPEHGIGGHLDTTKIDDSRDQATRAPIYSVYGDTDTKRRPAPEVIGSLDEIVFDIQDVGVRFYTYESTLGYFLEAAGKAHKPILVLDRPNPVGGAFVQGPVADRGRASFVDYGETPIRHGMTIGELAKMFNAESTLGAELTVVPMEGWMRGDWYDSTGKRWINPSPNMRSLNEATLYPGIGMIEATNISVGRGTDTPFEVIGAPWIQALPLSHYLNERSISGVRFLPVTFTPATSNYTKEACEGINLVITDRDALDSPELGLEIVSALQHLYPDHYKLEALDTLMVNKATMDAIRSNQDPRRIAEEWQDEIEAFQAVRQKYLLY